MILTCDKCSTKYSLSEDALQPMGKNVKCIKCGYIWFQDISSSLSHHSRHILLDPIPHGSALPVIIETRSSIWLKILPIFFICMIVVTSIGIFRDRIIEKLPAATKFYDLINLSPTENVKLENISIVRGKEFVNISGLIVNHSVSKRKVPEILISIASQDGKKLVSGVIPSSEQFLNPDEKHPLHKRIFNLPQDAHYVTINITDPLNLG